MRLARASLLLLLLAACARQRGPGLLDEPLPRNDSFAEHRVEPGQDWARISELYFGHPRHAERIAKDAGLSLADSTVAGQRIRVRIRPGEMEGVRRVELARGPYNEGVRLMRGGRDDRRALDAFDQALEQASHFLDARYNRGLLLLRMERPDDALRDLREVRKQRPGDRDAHYAVASAHFQLEQYDDALRALQPALELDPRFLRAHYTRALSLQRLGRDRDARAAWSHYLELDPDSAWAQEARRHLAELSL